MCMHIFSLMNQTKLGVCLHHLLEAEAQPGDCQEDDVSQEMKKPQESS